MELTITLVFSILSLAFALYLARWVLKNDDGPNEMRAISDTIREGAEAFLARQYKTIAALSLPVAVILFILYAYVRPASPHDPVPETWQMAAYVAGSFIFGAICSGIAGYVGMYVSIRSNIRTAIPVVVISAAIITSYYLGQASGIANAGLFGTAVATMGMLGTAAYILVMDTFGPIADNAGGIIEMSQQPEEIRKKTDRLDAVGNTTKALTKGYAIGSAALAAFLLFSAYLDEVRNYGVQLVSVDIAKPEVFVGGLLGAMLIFLFAALAIRAVGKAAYYVINEVRRQFREHPGILKGTEKPSYGQCVDIVAAGALKQMVLPGMLTVGTPIAVGLIFKQFGVGAEAVAALLMVGTMTGILVATMLNNGGGAWDNAKKFVETGEYGGKGSYTHKATVVGTPSVIHSRTPPVLRCTS